MNDENNHNDPIERLFREKAEEYNISYREEDWLKLEKQLDTRDVKIYYQRRFRWLAAASILILSLIGFYTFQNYNKINQLTEQLNQNEAVQQNEQVQSGQDFVADQNETDRQDSSRNKTEETEDGNQNADQSTEEGNDGLMIVEDETDGGNVNAERETFAQALLTIERESFAPARFNENLNSILAFANSTYEVIETEKRNFGRPSKSNNITEAENGPIALSDEDFSDQTFTSALSRLAVGVMVSPDLSTVGSVSNFYDPGFKGGLLAEYALTKNISLISGLAFSNVKYKASGREYDPPSAWNYGVMPDQTTAVCLVLDIPVSLKANFFNFERSRIFATAGVSSYIMLNEDYQFHYDGDSNGLQSSWSDRTGTRHWLSNAGFSIGFEYDLSPVWTLRAEPHIKIPLKGVGWGDVELYSMGSFISLNYKLGS